MASSDPRIQMIRIRSSKRSSWSPWVNEMDRATMLQHLDLAKRHIVEGQAHLSKQEKLIAKLAHDGHDTQDAIAIFATLRHTQTLHCEDYDRILKELGEPPRSKNSLELLNTSKPNTFLGRQTYEPFPKQED